MSDHEPLEPLAEDVLALLHDVKEVPELPSVAKDALFASIAARLPVPPAPGDGGGGDAGGGGTGSPPPALPVAGGGLGARAIAALATTFVLGTGAGVVLDRTLFAPPQPPPVVTAMAPLAPAPSSAPTPPAGPATVAIDSLPDVAPARPSSRTPRAVEPAPPSPSSRGLAAERALLDVARAGLARGAPDEALAAAERHGREYREGVLAEEREALAIKALVALGRRDEARTRAEVFERKYPNALGLRAVRAALEER
jgi:hypothetical protein